MTTTIKELAKTTGIATSELAAKAGELGFKGGTNAQLPEDIEKELTNIKTANSTNGNGNGNSDLSLSSEQKTINLSADLEEQLKAANIIGNIQADLVLEAMWQAYTTRMEEGESKIESDMIQRFSKYSKALSDLKTARKPPTTNQSITDKLMEMKANIEKK